MEPARKDLPDDEHDATPDPEALRLVARREHSLLSLMELSHELTLSLDLYSTADFALFNLMGQLGTSRAALWVLPRPPEDTPVLLRAHGIRKHLALPLGSSFGRLLIARAKESDEPVRTEELAPELDPAAARLAQQAGIAIFAPIFARARLFGFLALGGRVGGEPYGPVDLQVLSASLGMLGVTLENTRLYNHLLEQTRTLRVANENLKELDRLKSEFLRNVNHELRTPLTIIIAYLNIVLEQDGPTENRQFIETVLDESLKLKGLVEKLLDFSALSGEGLEIDLVKEDLVKLVQGLVEDRKPGVAETLHELLFVPGSPVPPLRFDPQRVRQILDALVDNAIKFTPTGCHIHLRVAQETDEEGRTWARVDVEDNGPGIPREQISGVFRPFHQLDGSMTRQVGGMGMGLTLAQKLAEKMQGRLTVESRTGLGSRFSLYLPTDLTTAA